MKHNIPGFFVEMKGRIIDGMSGSMEDEEEFDAAYTRQDIDRCDEILMTFLAGVFEPGVYADNDRIMAVVEEAVLALNVLNEECDQALIDTDQREGICELIIHAAADAGLKSEEHDITEEWREW